MAVQKALKIQKEGVATIVSDAPIPQVGDDRILVQIKAIALNPTDFKHIDRMWTAGATVGCDYAGVVVEVGKNVTDRKKGDRVAGFTHGSNADGLDDGCFAQFVSAKAAISARIPDSLSFEDAATLGVGVTTVGQLLNQNLGVELPTQPSSEKKPVLIYGASTATGTLAIQYAKMAGYEVIATSSPKNFDLVRSLGADHVLDYKSPTVGSDIRKLTNDSLKLVFDCIGENGSPEICSEALSSTGGTYGNILTGQSPREDVKTIRTLAYTCLGEAFNKMGMLWPASKEDFEFSTKVWKVTEELLKDGKIKTHPTKVVEGGLETILQSLDDLKAGKASGFKFVHTIA